MRFVRFSVKDAAEVLSGVHSEQGYEEISGDLFGDWTYTGKVYAPEEAVLHAPFVPREIIGIGKNFIADEAERQPAPALPILFYKPLTTVVGPSSPIVVPAGSTEVKFESELAVVIGKKARHLAEHEVASVIFGYTVANDVADTRFFHEEGHWTVGKAFDTFCPLGPVLDTAYTPGQSAIEAFVNGERKQDSPISLMITTIPQMVAYISQFMTLHPGDVILSGTPAGADMVRDGDVVECRIAGIGSLINPVVSA